MTAQIIDFSKYLPLNPPLDYTPDDYQDFLDDIEQIHWSVKQLAEEMGLSRSAIYSWKRSGVPIYAHKFVDMATQLDDALIRLGDKKAGAK